MHFNNIVIRGHFLLFTLGFHFGTSKVSCVLNNDGCHGWLLVSLHLPLIKGLPCWVFLWLDQSVDLCRQVTFHDLAVASRVGTRAGPHGTYPNSGDSGGSCHGALVFLMSPLTPASVTMLREIWRPCHGVNNRMDLPVSDRCSNRNCAPDDETFQC